jgi:hypothetical protein
MPTAQANIPSRKWEIMKNLFGLTPNSEILKDVSLRRNFLEKYV